MRKLWIPGGLLAIALIASAMLLSTGPVTAQQGAWVVNGGRDSNTCNIFSPDGANLYSGGATFVVTPSGRQLFSCHTSLVSGPGFDQTFTIRFNDPFLGACKITVTSGDQANATCHK